MELIPSTFPWVTTMHMWRSESNLELALSGHGNPLGRTPIVRLSNAFPHGAMSPASGTALSKASRSLEESVVTEGWKGSEAEGVSFSPFSPS